MNEEKSCCGSSSPMKKFLAPIVGIVLVLLGVYLVSLSINAWKNYDYIGKSPEFKNQVAVNGEGKVTVKPDVALINIGVTTEKITVAQAQKENVDKMNAVTKAIKDQFKIDEKDIQTSQYSISPKYDWSDGRQRIIGYSVNQSISIKARDFDKLGDILAKATELGANSVSGPNFIVDDVEKYREDARKEAIDQAKDKARVLADQVGIKLGSIVNFSENNGGYPIPMYDTAAGSRVSLEKSVSAPDIQSGSQDIIVDVTIIYEVK